MIKIISFVLRQRNLAPLNLIVSGRAQNWPRSWRSYLPCLLARSVGTFTFRRMHAGAIRPSSQYPFARILGSAPCLCATFLTPMPWRVEASGRIFTINLNFRLAQGSQFSIWAIRRGQKLTFLPLLCSRVGSGWWDG